MFQEHQAAHVRGVYHSLLCWALVTCVLMVVSSLLQLTG